MSTQMATKGLSEDLRVLILDLVDEMPSATSGELDNEFRTRYENLYKDKWDTQIDDETLWLEHQLKRAMEKRTVDRRTLELSLEAAASRTSQPDTKKIHIVHSDTTTNSTHPKTLLDWALWAANRGWRVFPCEENGKLPVTPNGFEDATKNPDAIRKLWTAGTETIIHRERDGANISVYGNPNYNYGVSLGPSNLVAYDYDTVTPFSGMPETFRVKSGRIVKEGEEGGFHDYYQGSCRTHSLFVEPVEPIVEHDEVTKKGDTVKAYYDALGRKVGKHGVTVGEIRSRGAYVIGPGSIHKSGQAYTITNDVPLVDSPEQNAEEVHTHGPAIGSDKQNEIAGFVEDAFDASGVDYKPRVSYRQGFMWLVDCPWEHEHSGGKNIREGGSSSAVFMTEEGKLGYQCQHAHCEDREWKELRGWMQEKAGKTLPFQPPTCTIRIGEESGSLEQGTTPTTVAAAIESGAIVAEDLVSEVASNDWEAVTIEGKPGENLEFKHPQTDIARLVVQLYGKNLTFATINEKGWWMFFTGKQWVECGRPKIRDFVRKSGEYIAAKILPKITGDDEETIKKRKWFLKLVSCCNDSTFTDKVMAWLQVRQVNIDQFDNKPMLFNFNNGTYDFKTNEFRKFNPNDLLTQVSPVNYNPSAECPTFDLMLANAFESPEMREFILRFMGYCMLGESKEKVFILFHGRGDNGKTVLVELLKSLLGNYAQTAEWDSFSISRSGSIRNDIAALHNARYVYCDEGEHDVKIAAGKLKALSGGGSMKARFLNKEYFTFLIKFKMILSTNIRPQLPSADQALWNRVLDIEMKNSYNPGHPKRIPDLEKKLWSEREGIMAKMVKGAHDFLKSGLNPPNEIRVSTENYRNAIDPLQTFFQSRCVFESGAFVGKQALYSAYENMCFFNKESAMSETALAERLRSMGIVESNRHDPRGWAGIRLLRVDGPERHPQGSLLSEDQQVL